MENAFIKIAIMFLIRAGWSKADAEFEVNVVIIERIGFDVFSNDPKSYIKASRIGAMISLSRMDRNRLVDSFVNALDHADFEINYSK